ncbi:16589_t:CDS:2 [Dentiscutata heterogama]|uniref:16589_t:CDS:1 n=1 Tax=Dentiscutata heterogama TaxID=1316150 RepID=A0ACA9KIW3_9GLOM|nr:16589_t:CDS:2 [Dentiscutata heterogama]
MPSQEHNLVGERQATHGVPDLDNLVPDSVSNHNKDVEFSESRITTEEKNDNSSQKDTPINNQYNQTRDTNVQNTEPMDWTPTKSDGSLPSPVRSRSRSGSESPSSNKSVAVNLIPLNDSISFTPKHLLFTPDQEMKVGRVSGSRNQKEAKADNGVFICDVMSREHAMLKEKNGKILIKDTKSTHGTFVNNSRLGDGTQDSEWRELYHGDVITFGHSVRRNQNLYKHLSACVYYPRGKKDGQNIPISLNGNSVIGHTIDSAKNKSDRLEEQSSSVAMTNIARIQNPPIEPSAQPTLLNNKKETTAETQSNNIAQKADDDQVTSANDADNDKKGSTESKSREVGPTESPGEVEKREVTTIANKTEVHPLKEEIVPSDDFHKVNEHKPVTPAITPDPSPVEAPVDDPVNNPQKTSAVTISIKEKVSSQALVETKSKNPCMGSNENVCYVSNGEGPSHANETQITTSIPYRKRKFEEVDNNLEQEQVDVLNRRLAELEERANKRRRWELITSTVIGMVAGVVSLGVGAYMLGN